MPSSPLTRFLAWLIVLGHAFVLFTPYDGVFEDLGSAWVLLFVLWIMLAVSLVRDTPARSDLAFHRTLPPGVNFAFWSMMRVPLAIGAGIALVVTGYVWRFHFSATSLGRGLALLTLPAAGFLSACGVAAGLASDRSVGKVRSWLAVFAPLVVSAFMFWLAVRNLHMVVGKYSLLRLMALIFLVAAIGYPLVWWRVSVGERLRGVVLAVIVLGMGLPWLYGSRWPAKVATPAHFQGRDFREESILSRKPSADPGKHLDYDVMEGGSDLKAGELASFLLTAGQPYDISGGVLDSRIMIIPHPGGKAGTPGARDGLHFMIGRFPDGSTAMGSDAVLAALSSRLPGGIRLESWDQAADHVHADLFSPSAPGNTAENGEGLLPNWRTELDAEDWFPLGSVATIPAPAVFDLEKGGSAASGNHGLIHVSPMAREGDNYIFRVERFTDEGWSIDGPLRIVEQNSPGSAPYLVIVDEEEKRAYLLNGTGEPGYSRVFLGCRQRVRFETGSMARSLPGSGERARRLSRLPACRLYVFWPHQVRWFRGKMAAPGR